MAKKTQMKECSRCKNRRVVQDVCGNCGDEIQKCDQCGNSMTDDDGEGVVFCHKNGHFCSEDCLVESFCASNCEYDIEHENIE
jgi:hypothetical protein